MTKKPQTKTNTGNIQQEERHREFMLAALRSATLRLKLMANEIDAIGVALSGDMIGCDTAIAWLRDQELLWTIPHIPEEIGRIETTFQPHGANSSETTQSCPMPTNQPETETYGEPL